MGSFPFFPFSCWDCVWFEPVQSVLVWCCLGLCELICASVLLCLDDTVSFGVLRHVSSNSAQILKSQREGLIKTYLLHEGKSVMFFNGLSLGISTTLLDSPRPRRSWPIQKELHVFCVLFVSFWNFCPNVLF